MEASFLLKYNAVIDWLNDLLVAVPLKYFSPAGACNYCFAWLRYKELRRVHIGKDGVCGNHAFCIRITT